MPQGTAKTRALVACVCMSIVCAGSAHANIVKGLVDLVELAGALRSVGKLRRFIEAGQVGPGARYLDFDADGIHAIDADDGSVTLWRAEPESGTQPRFNPAPDVDLLLLDADDAPELVERVGLELGRDALPRFAVVRDGSARRAYPIELDGTMRLLVEELPGTFVDIGSRQVGDVRWALEQPMLRERMRVVSLFHSEYDAPYLSRLDDAVGELHLPAGAGESLLETVAGAPGQQLFVVGHVEDGAFVVKDAGGNVTGPVALADLEAAARRSDSMLFFLGCNTAQVSRTTGFTRPVVATEVAGMLSAAIEQETLGGVLSTLSGAERILAQPSLVDPTRMTITLEQGRRKDARARSLTLVSVQLPSAARGRVLAREPLPTTAWLIMWYILGWALLLFGVHETLRRWRGSRRPAPRLGDRPLANLTTRFVRGVGFAAMMPLWTFAYVLAIAMIWLASVGLLVNPAGVAIAGYAGWRTQRERGIGDDAAWAVRYATVPVFMSMSLLATTCAFIYPGEGQPGFHLVGALAALACSGALYALLRRLRVSAPALLQALYRLPLALIETAVAPLVSERVASTPQSS